MHPKLSESTSLATAILAAQWDVKKNPTDARLRTYLFQLHCISRDWSRALSQLQAAAQFDPNATPMAQTYREAILCERYREDVFAGLRRPQFLGTPLKWTVCLVEALPLYAGGKFEQAAYLREQAFSEALSVSGALNDSEFEWLSDADSRIGPMIEVFTKGQYYWLALEYIQSLRVEAPTDLRDLVWSPVSITLRNEGELLGLMPVRYPVGSNPLTDAQKFSRLTEWNDLGADTWIGSGQRMFATDGGEFSMLETRSIQFST